mgnify:CR=1 FL=1
MNMFQKIGLAIVGILLVIVFIGMILEIPF